MTNMDVPHRSKLLYALSFAAQLGFLVVAPIAGFIWLGVVLDDLFGAAPAFVLTGVFLGSSVTAYETFQMLAPLIKPDNDKKG